MPKKTIKVVAQVTAFADKIAEVQAILQAIVAPTRLETGCLSYRLFRNSGIAVIPLSSCLLKMG